MSAPTIAWPPEFRPGVAPVHITNSLSMRVPAEAIWRLLIDAKGWPAFYPQAADVTIEGSAQLALGVRFRWKTMGLRIACSVREFEPGRRIAWDARGLGTWAYHAWVITPTAEGCHVHTEETQYGWLCRLGAAVMPGRLHVKWHQVWLEQLEQTALRPT